MISVNAHAYIITINPISHNRLGAGLCVDPVELPADDRAIQPGHQKLPPARLRDWMLCARTTACAMAFASTLEPPPDTLTVTAP